MRNIGPLADFFEAQVAADLAPAIGAIFFDGDQIVGQHFSGYARLALDPHFPDGLLFHEHVRLRVASISKLAVALYVGQLANIDLDADVSAYLGFPLRHKNWPDSPITARMLLSHTSGISDAGGYAGFVEENLADFFDSDHPLWQNGAHWRDGERPLGYFSYANLNYGLLGHVIEKQTGKRFDEAIAEGFLRPKGLSGGFNWSGVSARNMTQSAALYRKGAEHGPLWDSMIDRDPLLVTHQANIPTFGRHDEEGEPSAQLKAYQIGQNGALFSPQGGLRASLTDIMKLVRMLADSPLKAEVWRANAAMDNGDYEGLFFTSYGAGVHRIVPDPRHPIFARLKEPLIGHYGEAYGLLAGAWLGEVSGKGFVWATNGTKDDAPRFSHGGFQIEADVMAHGLAALDMLD